MMGILFLLGIINIIACWALGKSVNKMRHELESLFLFLKLYADELQRIHENAIFANDAMELLLWKARQEVYTWQQMWAQAEQYEAANQAKQVIQQMEAMINYHRTKMKDDEKLHNQRTDEPTV